MLLLARTPQPATRLELVYLGLMPAARGRGLGDLVMRQALRTSPPSASRRARRSPSTRGNAPALKLYYRHGMQRIGSKLALMRRPAELATWRDPDVKTLPEPTSDP